MTGLPLFPLSACVPPLSSGSAAVANIAANLAEALAARVVVAVNSVFCFKLLNLLQTSL